MEHAVHCFHCFESGSRFACWGGVACECLGLMLIAERLWVKCASTMAWLCSSAFACFGSVSQLFLMEVPLPCLVDSEEFLPVDCSHVCPYEGASRSQCFDLAVAIQLKKSRSPSAQTGHFGKHSFSEMPIQASPGALY